MACNIGPASMRWCTSRYGMHSGLKSTISHFVGQVISCCCLCWVTVWWVQLGQLPEDFQAGAFSSYIWPATWQLGLVHVGCISLLGIYEPCWRVHRCCSPILWAIHKVPGTSGRSFGGHVSRWIGALVHSNSIPRDAPHYWLLRDVLQAQLMRSSASSV